MRVVAVVMGIDQRAYGQVGYAADGLQKGAGAGLGEARVYHSNRVFPGQESGVVQPPGAVELNVGMHPWADFLHGRGRQFVGGMG